jgi:hypothetical protein
MHVWYFTSGIYEGQQNSCFFGWFTETVLYMETQKNQAI